MKVTKRKQQQQLLDQLVKTPVISIAVRRVGVSRATFYRWREKDDTFNAAVELALARGTDVVNDLAESKLINRIKEDDRWAINLWLSRHHARYMGQPSIVQAYAAPEVEQYDALHESIEVMKKGLGLLLEDAALKQQLLDAHIDVPPSSMEDASSEEVPIDDEPTYTFPDPGDD